jgi:hypothetical protein
VGVVAYENGVVKRKDLLTRVRIRKIRRTVLVMNARMVVKANILSLVRKVFVWALDIWSAHEPIVRGNRQARDDVLNIL